MSEHLDQQGILHGMVRFNLGLMSMPVHWRIWVGVLVVFNLLIPLFFITHLEAQLAIGVLLAAGILMAWLTAYSGFTRLLGLGHLVFWVPLLGYLWSRLEDWPVEEPLGLWLRVLLIINFISLIIDAIDVMRYFKGERGETVNTD